MLKYTCYHSVFKRGVKQWLSNIPEHGNNVQPALTGSVKGRMTILDKESPLKARWQKENAETSTAPGKG